MIMFVNGMIDRGICFKGCKAFEKIFLKQFDLINFASLSVH